MQRGLSIVFFAAIFQQVRNGSGSRLNCEKPPVVGSGTIEDGNASRLATACILQRTAAALTDYNAYAVFCPQTGWKGSAGDTRPPTIQLSEALTGGHIPPVPRCLLDQSCELHLGNVRSAATHLPEHRPAGPALPERKPGHALFLHKTGQPKQRLEIQLMQALPR